MSYIFDCQYLVGFGLDPNPVLEKSTWGQVQILKLMASARLFFRSWKSRADVCEVFIYFYFLYQARSRIETAFSRVLFLLNVLYLKHLKVAGPACKRQNISTNHLSSYPLTCGCSAATYNFTTRSHYILHPVPLGRFI